MTRHKPTCICIILLLSSFFSGCITLDTSKATVLRAYPPDATKLHDPHLTETDLRNMESNGIIYEYSPGDVVQLEIKSHSDIFEINPIPTITLEVQRKLYVYSGTMGLYLSLDGVQYKRFDRFFKGRFAVNLGMQKSTRTNNLDLILDLSSQPD